MSILKRIQDIVLANVNEVLDKIENPVCMVKHYIREMENEILQAEKALSRQMVIKKKHEMLIEETEAAIAKRDRQAKLAVETGEDHIAKLALQDKLLLEKKLEEYRKQHETIKQQTVSLGDQVKKMKEKHRELKNRQLVLLSRANAAQSMKKLQSFLSTVDAESVTKEFARLEERVLMMEIEANARRGTQGIDLGIESRFAEQAIQDEVEKELEKLKAKQAVSENKQ
ncbi:protein LiaH [Collibacillus ludicampi]|uniref:Protein LiaH n=1 Tax=Collibacillus ludicampi TaxID=2771369 RepID=A0AAV4LCB5_9BACL|nr:PspA/IM30 family protein [Collibacillus ludicampi]GIM45304.1 protein LiaH [Collibacillus ludicampi]